MEGSDTYMNETGFNSRVTALAPLAHTLFTASPKLEQLAEGFSFSEGPVWDAAAECLYFTDFREDKIYRWVEGEEAKLYTAQSNRAIGLSMDAQGRIVSTESGLHRIAYVDDVGSTGIVDAYEGKRLNSPNDVVVARDGGIWFTDPCSAIMQDVRELSINGVYRATPQGDVTLICDTFGRPNGIALSPDEKTLYVNDTDLQQVFSLKLNEDNTAEPPVLLGTMDIAYGRGAADGMKVDTLGNIWLTGPGGIWVFTPEGEAVAILHCPASVGNFCFGGKEGRTLFICASSAVYKTDIGVEGIRPHRA